MGAEPVQSFQDLILNGDRVGSLFPYVENTQRAVLIGGKKKVSVWALLSTQVDQLIQVMAGFTQQTGLTWDQAINQQPQVVQTVLAASWQ